ncbi:MAG: hypothetical protein ABIE22_03640 [archaeon]
MGTGSGNVDVDETTEIMRRAFKVKPVLQDLRARLTEVVSKLNKKRPLRERLHRRTYDLETDDGNFLIIRSAPLPYGPAAAWGYRKDPKTVAKINVVEKLESGDKLPSLSLEGYIEGGWWGAERIGRVVSYLHEKHNIPIGDLAEYLLRG